MKTEQEKIEEKLESAKKMLQANLNAGAQADNYNVIKLQGEIANLETSVAKFNPAKVALESAYNAPQAQKLTAIRTDAKRMDEIDQNVQKVRLGYMTESEAMNQDY